MSVLIDTRALSRDLYERCAAAVVKQYDAHADDPIAAAAAEQRAEAERLGWSPEAVHMLDLTVRTVGDELLFAVEVDEATPVITVAGYPVVGVLS